MKQKIKKNNICHKKKFQLKQSILKEKAKDKKAIFSPKNIWIRTINLKRYKAKDKK